MIRFDKLSALSEEELKRTLGITKKNFDYLCILVKNHINDEKEAKPMKKHGAKGTLLLEDKLLITLYYLRNYSTFLVISHFFEISESYSNKIYHKFSNIILKVLHLPNRKKLMDNGLEAIIIDVSEQPIERPKKKQKDYYSGKKKDIQ